MGERLQMDSLLELLGSFRCHLNRDGKPMVVFLQDNFDQYLLAVKEAANPANNPLLGQTMCQMVSDSINRVEKHANGLIEVLRLYLSGKIVPASIKAFEIFDDMKPQLMIRYSGAERFETYFRIREIDDAKPFPLERKELFHIPYSKNYLVGTERYSMPGHPCLYLASQAELCWYECGRPQKFAISKFDIPQSENNYFKYIDFSEKLMPLMHSFFSWFHNDNDRNAVEKYLLKYICTYPLRAACSVVVEHQGCKFIEEYIIPQLLLQWVINDDDFDGIRYESCNASDEVKCMGGHNIVLPSKVFDADGFDIKLRANVKVGHPSVFDTNNIVVPAWIEELLSGKDIKTEPFHWNLEDISAEYQVV